MTIRKGEDWGRVVRRPEGLRTVESDRALTAALADGTARPVLVRGGDLARTLGSRIGCEGDAVNELPIDLLRVTLDRGGTHTAAAHVIVRRPRRSGSWFVGEVLFVMNAQFLGAWDLIPRGHPNDGRADVLRVDPSLHLRQRIEAARRAPAGRHLPHPGLRLSRIESADFEFDRPMEIVVDGARVGTARSLALDVAADAAVVHT